MQFLAPKYPTQFLAPLVPLSFAHSAPLILLGEKSSLPTGNSKASNVCRQSSLSTLILET
jgi:hypothetical protein